MILLPVSMFWIGLFKPLTRNNEVVDRDVAENTLPRLVVELEAWLAVLALKPKALCGPLSRCPFS